MKLPNVIERDGEFWFEWRYAAGLIGKTKRKFRTMLELGEVEYREERKGCWFVRESWVTEQRRANPPKADKPPSRRGLGEKMIAASRATRTLSGGGGDSDQATLNWSRFDSKGRLT